MGCITYIYNTKFGMWWVASHTYIIQSLACDGLYLMVKIMYLYCSIKQKRIKLVVPVTNVIVSFFTVHGISSNCCLAWNIINHYIIFFYLILYSLVIQLVIQYYQELKVMFLYLWCPAINSLHPVLYKYRTMT